MISVFHPERAALELYLVTIPVRPEAESPWADVAECGFMEMVLYGASPEDAEQRALTITRCMYCRVEEGFATVKPASSIKEDKAWVIEQAKEDLLYFQFGFCAVGMKQEVYPNWPYSIK